MKIQRPKWFTIISLLLGWLSIGGFGNFYMMQQTEHFGASTLPLSIFALLYGILAIVTSIGLWKMKNWSFFTFSLWSLNAIVGMIIFYITFQKNMPLFGTIIFMAVFTAILFFVAKYIRKVLNGEP